MGENERMAMAAIVNEAVALCPVGARTFIGLLIVWLQRRRVHEVGLGRVSRHMNQTVCTQRNSGKCDNEQPYHCSLGVQAKRYVTGE